MWCAACNHCCWCAEQHRPVFLLLGPSAHSWRCHQPEPPPQLWLQSLDQKGRLCTYVEEIRNTMSGLWTNDSTVANLKNHLNACLFQIDWCQFPYTSVLTNAGCFSYWLKGQLIWGQRLAGAVACVIDNCCNLCTVFFSNLSCLKYQHSQRNCLW